MIFQEITNLLSNRGFFLRAKKNKNIFLAEKASVNSGIGRK